MLSTGRLRLIPPVAWLLLFTSLGFGSDGKKEETEPLPLVVVSGSQSSLHLKPPLGLSVFSVLSRQTEVCTNFAVRSRESILSRVIVTSVGLGDTTLTDPAANPPTRQSTLLLASVTPDGRILRTCLPSSLVPNPGDTIEGKLLVLAGDRKAIELPLKLDKPSSDPISAALQWFVALALPALIAMLIASLTAYLTERRKQKVRFEKFSDLAYTDLRDFFVTHYATLHREHKEPIRFSSALESALREQRIWSRIPDRERHRLISCLRASRTEATRDLLMKLFADWKDKIRNPT